MSDSTLPSRPRRSLLLGRDCPPMAGPVATRVAGRGYWPLRYSATAAISSAVIFSATVCITALSLLRAR